MDKLTAPVQVNLTERERGEWKRAADRQGMTLAEFIRRLVRRALKNGGKS